MSIKDTFLNFEFLDNNPLMSTGDIFSSPFSVVIEDHPDADRWIKDLLYASDYTTTRPTTARLVWWTTPQIVAIEYCDVLGSSLDSYVLETYSRWTWTNVVTFDSSINKWINYQGGTWFDLITCSVDPNNDTLALQSFQAQQLYEIKWLF